MALSSPSSSITTPINTISAFPSYSTNRDSSPAASSSSAQHDDHPDSNRRIHHSFGDSETDQQRTGFFRGIMIFVDDVSAIRDDTWSCVIVVLTFWFFVSMTLILGVYGAASVTIGPNSSVLIQPNPVFVQSIKVEVLDGNPGLMLYGLYETPPLNVVKPWSKFINATVSADFHQEWTYFMNQGSEINISYSVNPPSSSLFVVVAQGNDGLSLWLEDPTYPNTTLSWNVVHGSGLIQQKISKSSSYYVAVGNLNTEDAKVELILNINSLLYNTNEAYYKCTFTNDICSLSVLFPNGNSIVLSSPSSDDESTSDEWYIKVSYGPRWATYIVGIATLTVIMLGAFNFLNKFQCIREEEETGGWYAVGEDARAPLLSHKDDDLSSWGSSYDSASNDDEDLENFMVSNSLEGKSSRDSESGNDTRRLCAICFDAPRDCFFLPCGHCVACFECGTRIGEAAGTCPVCHRNMKKVRKIFTV